MPRRIACLLVPNFPLAARIRRDPRLANTPAAVLYEEGIASPIVAVGRVARERGIRPGHSLVQARALFPGLMALPRDRSAEQSAQETLLEAASALSPIVEDAGSGCLFLNLQGVRNELALCQEAVRAAAAVGLRASAGVAGGRLTARLAAQLGPGRPAIVPQAGEAAYLARFPLAWLDAPPPLIARLSHWGVRTAGEFAAISAGEVVRRLGPEGLALHRAVRGLDEKPLAAWRRPAVLSERIDLDWTLCDLQPLLAVARPILERLTTRLLASGTACRRLDLTLALDPKGKEERALQLAAPTTEVRTLAELIGLELAARPPSAPVAGLALQAHPDRPRQVQFSLFGPAAHSPDALATVIARLSVLLGAERIGSPRTVDGHRPERYALADFFPSPPPKISPLVERKSLVAAVRILRPRISLEVRTAESPLRPVYLQTGRENRSSSRVSGRVRVASGPWRLEESWWSEEALSRDYWDVELFDGGVYRIFRDLQKDRWFADGIYD